MVFSRFRLGFNLGPMRQNGRRVLCSQNRIEFLVDGLNKMSTSWYVKLNIRVFPWEGHFFISTSCKETDPSSFLDAAEQLPAWKVGRFWQSNKRQRSGALQCFLDEMNSNSTFTMDWCVHRSSQKLFVSNSCGILWSYSLGLQALDATDSHLSGNCSNIIC